MSKYGYYLDLSDKVFESVRFLNIAPKTDGFGAEAIQKTDKDGQPIWLLSCLVKVSGGTAFTETFTLTASRKSVDELMKTPELTPIALVGLAGGKWSKAASDRTEWSFQVSGFRVL